MYIKIADIPSDTMKPVLQELQDQLELKQNANKES